MSCNSLPLGTCRELWLIIPSPWLQLPASEVQDFTSNSHNASIVLLFTVYAYQLLNIALNNFVSTDILSTNY